MAQHYDRQDCCKQFSPVSARTWFPAPEANRIVHSEFTIIVQECLRKDACVITIEEVHQAMPQFGFLRRHVKIDRGASYDALLLFIQTHCHADSACPPGRYHKMVQSRARLRLKSSELQTLPYHEITELLGDG